MSPGVTMTNSPLSDSRIHRHNVFYPIERPIAVRKGDCVDIAFDVIPKRSMDNWSVEVKRGGRVHRTLCAFDNARHTDQQGIPAQDSTRVYTGPHSMGIGSSYGDWLVVRSLTCVTASVPCVRSNNRSMSAIRTCFKLRARRNLSSRRWFRAMRKGNLNQPYRSVTPRDWLTYICDPNFV
jgi:hypothetical protein